MWILGFLQSVTRLVTVIEWKNTDFSTTWAGFALVFTFESCLGIEYWLFGLEFYLASFAIEEKLKGLRATNSVIKRNKACIFWTVSAVFAILIAGGSLAQMKINRQNIQQNKKVQVNTLPAFIMTIFSSASSILLVKAMLNLRKISRQYTGIKETRFAISTYLTLFTMELVLNCCWIPL